jgi:peptidoglycan/xylan/chitin deacetylase (PgdA/CDA1 family)
MTKRKNAGLAKSLACSALAAARLDAWASRGGPIVLGYHRVVEDPLAANVMPGLAVSSAMLELQLDWVGKRARFVSLDELGELVDRRRGEPGPAAAAVTFDDGYADVRELAYPLLRRKGIPGAVFVVSDALGEKPLAHDRLYRALSWFLPASGQTGRSPYEVTRALIDSVSPDGIEGIIEALDAEGGPALGAETGELLDWEAVRALQRGGMTIGSHTRHHVRLVGRGSAEVAAELGESRRRLEEGLGAPVLHFAYPDGQFDRAVVGAAAAAGYRYGYTCCHHRDPEHPALTIPRAMLWERSSLDHRNRFSPAILACQAYGAMPMLDRCTRGHR